MASAAGLNDDFRDLLQTLLDSEAVFLVIGAHAVAFHGVARATGDLDVLVEPSEANAERVVAALEAFGAPLGLHGVTAGDFAVPGLVYQIGLPPRRIDILTEISGVTFERAWLTRVEAEVAGLRFHVIGREALLENKRATGRPKDLLDVELLEGQSAD